MFMNDKVNVPILGLIENMAWFTPAELPENKYYIFGREGGVKVAEQYGVPLLGQIPLVQAICECGDSGEPIALHPETPDGQAFLRLAASLAYNTERRNDTQEPTKIVDTH